MPTEVAEGISSIKNVSPSVGYVHRRWVFVSIGPKRYDHNNYIDHL